MSKLDDAERIDPNGPGLDKALARTRDYSDLMAVNIDQLLAAYSVQATDSNKILMCKAAGATIVTIPAGLNDFTTGAAVCIGRYGSAPVTIVPGAGVTFELPQSVAQPLTINSRYGVVRATKLAPDRWLLRDALTATG